MPKAKARRLLAVTLLELVIVIAVVGVVFIVGVEIFGQIIKNSNKANVISEVKQNGTIALSFLEQEIRSARAACTSSPINELRLDKSGTACTTSLVKFICTAGAPGANGKLQYDKGTGMVVDITNTDPISGIDITNCPSWYSLQIRAGAPTVVKITLKINQGVQAPTRYDFLANVTLETSVSLRTY